MPLHQSLVEASPFIGIPDALQVSGKGPRGGLVAFLAMARETGHILEKVVEFVPKKTLPYLSPYLPHP